MSQYSAIINHANGSYVQFSDCCGSESVFLKMVMKNNFFLYRLLWVFLTGKQVHSIIVSGVDNDDKSGYVWLKKKMLSHFSMARSLFFFVPGLFCAQNDHCDTLSLKFLEPEQMVNFIIYNFESFDKKKMSTSFSHVISFCLHFNTQSSLTLSYLYFFF